MSTAPRLLGIFQPGTPGWAQARSGDCITATEIPAVLGLSPWQSRFSLWHIKAGNISGEFEQSPVMEWGNRLEDAVATKWADNHPDAQVAPGGTWANGEWSWQRATPDRVLLRDDDQPGEVLEVKTAPFGDGWGETGTGDIPVHYRAQVIWQLDTLSLTRAHLAVLISGWDYREYVIDYDPDDAEMMAAAGRRFLDSVKAGTPPSIDGSDATYRAVKQLPDGVIDDPVNIDPDLADAYRQALAAEKTAKDHARRQRALILDALGNHLRAETAGESVATRTVHPDGTTRSLMPARRKALA